MHDPFTIERFLPQVGEVFRVTLASGGEVPILLTEITRLASEGDRRRTREPFSLIFHASREAGPEQGTYRLTDPAGATFECLLVPLMPDANGLRFEAVYT
jgi:hypothetical protein